MNKNAASVVLQFITENSLKSEAIDENSTLIYLPDGLFTLEGFSIHNRFIGIIRQYSDEQLEFCVVTPLVTVDDGELPPYIANALLKMNGRFESGSWSLRDLGDGTWSPEIVHNFLISEFTIQRLRRALLVSIGMVKKLQVTLSQFMQQNEHVVDYQGKLPTNFRKSLVL